MRRTMMLAAAVIVAANVIARRPRPNPERDELLDDIDRWAKAPPSDAQLHEWATL
jgi:hypothetical protein